MCLCSMEGVKANEQRKKAPVSCMLLSAFKDTVNPKMKMHVIIY